MDRFECVNRALDALPRTRFGRLGREAPAFRSCGILGFFAGLVVTLGAGLARGRSLAVLGALAALCGASFFAYARLRRSLARREELVLLEHVWVALALCAGALLATREPPLGYLDAVASGLAFFLAAGRAGCFLVGCCRGLPSVLGVRYGPEHAEDGFPSAWIGVRLFPVQLVESAALVAIGGGAVLFALFGADGSAFTFFLVAYAIVRFGLEGLRGDERPHLLGVSQSRWMAVAEVGFAVALSERARAHPWAFAVLGALAAAWIARAARERFFGSRARALRPSHLVALREAAGAAPAAPLVAIRSPLGFGVAASPTRRGRLVSLSLPAGTVDLALACAVAARAFPEADPATAVLTYHRVLVFEVPALSAEVPAAVPQLEARLHAAVALADQMGEPYAPEHAVRASPTRPSGAPSPSAAPDPVARARYFAARPPARP